MVKTQGSRAKQGQIFINHKGVSIPTSVGSRRYEFKYGGGKNTLSTGTIPLGFAHRPDLISDLFVDTPDLWWMVCEDNSIFDVFEQLNSGDLIRLPASL
tara:strand:+ start:2812 stop:3108 length:297 start_codon:yes stop_codon:yes gene_type:complete